MEQTIELRIVDPKTLTYADKRDPRQVPADRLSDAALKANSNAIGFVQPPSSPRGTGNLTIIAAPPHQERDRQQAQGNGDLRQTGRSLDDMRAVAENARAPMPPVHYGVPSKILPRELDGGKRSRQPSPAAPTSPQARLLDIHPTILKHMAARHAQATPLHDHRCLSPTGRAPGEPESEKVRDCDLARHRHSLTKRQMFASDARFGRNETTAFGIISTEPVRPGRRGQPVHDRRRRLSWRAAAWLEANVPKNGEIVQVDDYGAAGSRRADPGLGRQAREDRVARFVDRETVRSARSIPRPCPAARRRRPAPATMLQPLIPGPVPTSPRGPRDDRRDAHRGARRGARTRGLASERLSASRARPGFGQRLHPHPRIRPDPSIVGVIAEAGELTSTRRSSRRLPSRFFSC